MALVNMNQMLRDAREGGYGIGNFDVFNIEMLKGVIQAAEEMRSPAIVAYGEGFMDYISLEAFTPLAVEIAKKATVPIALHLDHAVGFDVILKAIKYGFTSVMMDASDQTLEENIRLTKSVSDICKVFDISVEAEIGHVSGLGDLYENDDYKYTDVGEAVHFVENSGATALAIAIGTVHGEYSEEPDLNFKRIAEIKEAVDIPLVLHGASGLSADDLKKAVENGISKVNIFTDLTLKSLQAVKDNINKDGISLMGICEKITEATKLEAIEKIRVLGSAGKA